MTQRQGKAWSATFKQLPGRDLDIDGVSCGKVKGSYPAGAKLNGTYTAGQGFGGIRSVSTYGFGPDGTFTKEAVGSARRSAAGAVSTSVKPGPFRLSVNTLEHESDVQSTQHLIYEMPEGSGTQMMIDGYAWKKN